MWHTVFIAAHAAAGGIALLTGCVTIARRALFRTYLTGLIIMELALLLAVAVEWAGLDPGTRVLFGALTALGLVMLWRAESARRLVPRIGARPSAPYVAHVGFTLVSLFDAFVVVLVLDLGAPGWLVATSGVAIAVAGHFALRWARVRLTAVERPAGTAGAPTASP